MTMAGSIIRRDNLGSFWLKIAGYTKIGIDESFGTYDRQWLYREIYKQFMLTGPDQNHSVVLVWDKENRHDCYAMKADLRCGPRSSIKEFDGYNLGYIPSIHAFEIRKNRDFILPGMIIRTEYDGGGNVFATVAFAYNTLDKNRRFTNMAEEINE